MEYNEKTNNPTKKVLKENKQQNKKTNEIFF
jgi:hypothetical protein